MHLAPFGGCGLIRRGGASPPEAKREGAVARALSVKLAAGLGYAQLPALYEPVAVTPIAFAGPCLKAVQPPTSTATQ